MNISKFQDLLDSKIKDIKKCLPETSVPFFWFKLQSINPLALSDNSGNTIIVNVPPHVKSIIETLIHQQKLGLKTTSIDIVALEKNQSDILIKQLYYSRSKIQNLQILFFINANNHKYFEKSTLKILTRYIKQVTKKWQFPQPLSNQQLIQMVNLQERVRILSKKNILVEKQLIPKLPQIDFLDQKSLFLLQKIKPHIDKSELFMKMIGFNFKNNESKRIIRNMIFPNQKTNQSDRLKIIKKTYSSAVIKQLIKIYKSS